MSETLSSVAAPGHNQPDETPITLAYKARTPGSAQLAQEAATCFPSGVTHDSRYLKPYGLYVDRAQGAHKWDVDGNRYIDFFGGHGALLLGHNHPGVMPAVHAALDRSTQFAASHAHEIRWAELVKEMVPCAERVRFTSSGTEATSMAIRLARAFTGKRRILRFKGHFHGWHDDAAMGYSSHFDGSAPIGVPDTVAGNSILLDVNDFAALDEVFSSEKDLAAVVVEALGAATGMVPLAPGFHAKLRELSTRHGVVLIFDEVITGFRAAPGGVQEMLGVTPDLTAFAKILAGGMPGGAVAGREDILARLDFDRMRENGKEKMVHPGTFNANPVSASAGIAALEIIKNTDACAKAAASANALIDGWNAVLADEDLPWIAYGECSTFHLYMNPDDHGFDRDRFDPLTLNRAQLQKKDAETVRQLRLALLANSIDISGWPGGLLSAVHSSEDISDSIDAFRESVRMLKKI